MIPPRESPCPDCWIPAEERAAKGLIGDEVANRIIQKRGHLVVALPYCDGYQGQVLRSFAGMELSQPIVLTRKTNQEEWKTQLKAIGPFAQPRKDVPRCSPGDPRFATADYWQAVTD